MTTPAALRTTIQSYLATQLGGLSPAWSVSRYAFPLFPPADVDSVLPRSFAVGVLGGTVFAELSRQRPTGNGAYAETTFGVRFCWRIRADSHVADYATALASEATLAAYMMTISSPAISHRRLVGVPTRDLIAVEGGSSWYVGQVDLAVNHWYDLTT